MTNATSQQAAEATVYAMAAGLASLPLPKYTVQFTPGQLATINAVYEAARFRGQGGVTGPVAGNPSPRGPRHAAEASTSLV